MALEARFAIWLNLALAHRQNESKHHQPMPKQDKIRQSRDATASASPAAKGGGAKGAGSEAAATPKEDSEPKALAQKVQMRDIAKLAGVSKSTVSRALADNPAINEKTRELIQSLARKHNYRVNQRARNFRRKDTLTIAVLLAGSPSADWHLTDPFFFEMLREISIALDDHGHQLLLARNRPQKSEWIEDFVDSAMADGVILLGQGKLHRQISRIADHYKAISVWGAQVDETQNYSTVGTNNVLGGLRATRHLLEIGCRRILYLGSHKMPEPQQRLQGYLNAHREFGVETVPELHEDNSGDEENAYLCVCRLVNQKVGFDGIFASSDLFAMAAIRALGSVGLAVPDDVAVVGYDDVSLSRFYLPPISTIRQNRSVGGKILVDNLLAVMAGGTPECVSLNPELIVRQSSNRGRGGALGTHPVPELADASSGGSQ